MKDDTREHAGDVDVATTARAFWDAYFASRGLAILEAWEHPNVVPIQTGAYRRYAQGMKPASGGEGGQA